MFFIYGAHNSKVCDKAEFLLYTLGHDYRLYIFGRDYTLNQLQKLVPGTTTIPHIFLGTKYLGGIKELYEYLYESENNARNSGGETGYRMPKSLFNSMVENKQNCSDNSNKE